MTNTQSRPVRRIGLAFLLLCAVSAYRQVSRHLFPGDYARPVVVYAVYVLLLAGWWGAPASTPTASSPPSRSS